MRTHITEPPCLTSKLKYLSSIVVSSVTGIMNSTARWDREKIDWEKN